MVLLSFPTRRTPDLTFFLLCSDDYVSFSKINSRLLNTPTPLKNVPIRIYIPSSPHDPTDAAPGSFKVVQALVPPRLPSSEFLSVPFSPPITSRFHLNPRLPHGGT